MSDELNYVSKRQRTENGMGNTMDRPTLLMKPHKLRETTTKKEILGQGTDDFANKHQALDMYPPMYA